MGYDVPPRKFAYLPVNDDLVLVDVSTVQRYALLELARQGDTAATLELLADEYHEVHMRAYRLEGERDEAREWARRMRDERDKLRIAFEDAENCWRGDVERLEKSLDGCYKKQKWYADALDIEHETGMSWYEENSSLIGQLTLAKKEIEDLEHKYKQATCEHGLIYHLEPGKTYTITYRQLDECPDCGKRLR